MYTMSLIKQIIEQMAGVTNNINGTPPPKPTILTATKANANLEKK